MMRCSGAQIVWEMLRHERVEVVFGIPGGSIVTTYHRRQDHGIRHVLVRHEQAAAHAADGYARASGRVGVVMATSGPGATNLTTGIATAMMDSVPMVCITGQVRTSLIGSDAFQEADITGITLPITKHNYLVTRVEDLAETLQEAFHVASSGRPGPVLIDLPADVQSAETSFDTPTGIVTLPGYHPVCDIKDDAIRKIAAMLHASRRPVLLAGHGVVCACAESLLRTVAETADIPVATTLLGKGGFPKRHRLNLGMMGMHGDAAANLAIQDADLLIALGMRFDDRVTGLPDRFAPNAYRIHVDHDPAEIGKNIAVDLGVVGDVRDVLQRLVALVEHTSRSEWHTHIEPWKEEASERDLLTHSDGTTLTAPHVLDEIRRQAHGRAIIVADVGQNQMWAAQYSEVPGGRSFITSGGLGTMGYALPAAVGAQIAVPDAEVWVVVGDGGFQMNVQELATVTQEGLPLRIAVLNNGCLGMVRQWQELFYDRRYESTILHNPDFVRLAQAYGIPASRVSRSEDLAPAVADAHAAASSALVEFQIVGEGEEGNVYPMVPAGAALHEMLRRPLAIGSVQQPRSDA